MTKKLPITRDEKERKVIELSERGMNIRDISKKVHMSFSDIGRITRKLSGGGQNLERSKKYSKHVHALELFQSGASNLEVATRVDLKDFETIEEQNQYRRLIGDDKFCEFYDQIKGDLESHLVLHNELKMAGISARQAIEGITFARQLDNMKSEFNIIWNEKQRLEGENYQLKQKNETLRWEVQTLEQAKSAIRNEVSIFRETNEISSVPNFPRKRERRRHSNLNR